IERIGSNWSPGIGGVLVVEAEKNLYAPAGKTSRVTSRAAVAAGKLAPRPSGSISAGSMAEGAESS
ncbi:MAG: methyltransferase type 11, partial [Pseudomonadota bacterium]|nr:methyltransferase type 11 [Pseudomonadota bacterium]